MLTLKEACGKALDNMLEKQGNYGICEVAELPDKWIFLGYGGGVYGNTPVTVSKNSGEIRNFSFAIPENYEKYYHESELLEVPEEYR